MSEQGSQHSIIEDLPDTHPEAHFDVQSDIENQVTAQEEEERIKENYRPKSVALPPPPEPPEEYLQAQDALEDLQNELQGFLGNYIPKVATLQALVASNVHAAPAHLGMRGGPFLSRATSRIIRGSMLLHGPEGPGSPETYPDALSDRAVCDQDPAAPSLRHSVYRRKTPVDGHMQALQTFLMTHMENVRTLQTSMSGGASTDEHANPKRQARTAHVSKPSVEHSSDDDLRLAQHLHSEVQTATLTAIVIIALCILAFIILNGEKQMAFNVGMLFAFYSLAFQFGIIVLAGKGSRYLFHQSIAVDKSKSQLDDAYFIFYLTICEQLQLLGALFLVVSAAIMAFLIFSSLAFPLLVIFLSAFGGIVVSVSAYYKVLITSDNIIFLAKNARRLGWRSLDFVRTEVNARRKAF
ncbi:hypothetical protein CPB83DRAFT_838330 [Crepidotus variabilis]|uniref:Uncharacterized protein n=1 Tax=Crepidotus variabilis TaxID=179855 RepID=A0A9P6JLZ2_9AGAR|nr:hypothetical protein CPB83DRAFT_838330 [Crepidotus variabilis]